MTGGVLMPDLYAQGFAAGERAAWRERQSGARETLRRQHIPEWDRGWLDGYAPRDLGWATGRKPVGRRAASLDAA